MGRRVDPYLKQRGFTLIELIMVIVIILMLSAASLMVINRATRKGMEVRARKEIQHTGVALRMYGEDVGYYPVDLGIFDGSAKLVQALEQDSGAGYAGKPYATWPSEAKTGGGLRDPWGEQYQYFTNTADSWFKGGDKGVAWNMWSYGPKGNVVGLTPDDYIKNWQDDPQPP